MTSAAEMNSLLAGSFDKVERTIQDCVSTFNAGITRIEHSQYVLYYWREKIHHATTLIRKELDRLVQLVRTALENRTPIVSLIIQAFNWLDDVKHPMTGRTHQPTATALAAEWEGKAATAYQTRVTAQNDAIIAVAGKAQSVSDWLVEIAQLNINYMTGLLKIVTDFLAALTAAAIETAAVLTIPAAIERCAGAIGTVVGQQLSYLVESGQRMVEAFAKVHKLKSQESDVKLPNGRWPEAVIG